eukprot:scaffold123274_cov18-Prasinocladus_malaysianus.AAC.1
MTGTAPTNLDAHNGHCDRYKYKDVSIASAMVRHYHTGDSTPFTIAAIMSRSIRQSREKIIA